MTVGWAAAFARTQFIEVPLYALSLRAHGPARAALLGFGASAVTHPIVCFVLRRMVVPAVGFPAYVALAETFAVIAEALFLRAAGVTRPRAFLVALAANVASVVAGFVLLG